MKLLDKLYLFFLRFYFWTIVFSIIYVNPNITEEELEELYPKIARDIGAVYVKK